MSNYLPPMAFQKIAVHPERERGMWLISSEDLARLMGVSAARLPDPATVTTTVNFSLLSPESHSAPIVTARDRSRIARFAYYLGRPLRRRYTR